MTIEKFKNNVIIKSITVFFIRFIRKDFRIKAAIFFIGLILWFNINLENDFETNVDIPIKLAKMKPRHTLLNSIPEYARVKLKSQGKALIFLDYNSSLYFELDLSQVSNSKIFKLDPVSFINTTSNNIELLSVQSPKFVEVEIDTMISKYVPVILRQKFKTKPGYTITGKFYQNPESVQVWGPLKKIERITRLFTETKKDLILDKDYKASLQIINENDKTIKYSAEKVDLYQKIVRLGSNTMKILIRKQNVPPGKKFLIDPVYVDLVLSGPVSELQKISEEDFSVYVNYLEIDRLQMNVEIKTDTNVDLDWKISTKTAKVIE